MSEAPELKPCPFCGGPAVFVVGSDELVGVECNGYIYCAANVESLFLDEDEAATAWNRRAA